MSIFDSIVDSLCTSPEHLRNFAATSPYRYKVYDIPKRSGSGKRKIAHPAKQLKYIQRLAVHELEKFFTPHESAFAYVKGKSIRDNAKVHVRNEYLLKMDFKDFFPSITPELFFAQVEKLGTTFCDEDKVFLSNILFYKLRSYSKLRLSIGAPSSPFVSNIVMREFDIKISEFCKTKSIAYSRYADDLCFSTNISGLLFELPKLVTKTLKSNGYAELKMNRSKTVYSSKGHNRHVTGVTLSNDEKLSVGRSKKRETIARVHHYLNGRLTPEQVESLQGYLSFVFHIEPEFKIRLHKKYGNEAIEMLLSERKID
ncbi:retron St85 family RNA-directed DNA polymerase [Alteromonas flava]|uniref:retron St85 family RNA-directed DNA polymerase n=1 Tax=Alteromonas flava TaxID=2048003 RepID=UPI000C2912C1|nr:retron St85 family RNA-directed DNA polymerase [Alteromonas flava]